MILGRNNRREANTLNYVCRSKSAEYYSKDYDGDGEI